MIESGELVEVPVEALQLKDTIMVAKAVRSRSTVS